MQSVTAIVESPKGSNIKYVYDEKSGEFREKRRLKVGMQFPFDFGFIPGTLAEDGDPVDVMLIAESGTYTGCKINCRIIGGLVVQQKIFKTGLLIRNDR